jgi:hypothetical protein
MAEATAAPQQPAAYRLVAADELGVLKGEPAATADALVATCCHLQHHHNQGSQLL